MRALQELRDCAPGIERDPKDGHIAGRLRNILFSSPINILARRVVGDEDGMNIIRFHANCS